MRGSPAVLAAAALLLACAPLASQTFRSTVTLVEVDVSVIDQQRRPVRGLQEYDFAVFEDGVPQPIGTFAEIDVPPAGPRPTGWMRTVSPDVASNIARASRLVVIMLDDALGSADPRIARNVREIGQRIVDRLGPGDQAAVLFTRNDARAQDFTADRTRLLSAIGTFAAGGGNEMAGYFSPATIGRLLGVTAALGNTPQRQKVLIYVSPGLPSSFGPPLLGRGIRGVEAADQRGLMLQTMQDAQRANVSVYSIDPRGLDTEAEGHPNDFLQALSESTGGFAVVNRNGFDDSIAQIFRENESYYLIGYRPTNTSTDTAYRHIGVRVYRQGLVVHARDGYSKPPPAPERGVGGSSSQLTDALHAIVPRSDLGMQVTAAPFAGAGRKAAIVVVAAVRQPAPAGGAVAVEDSEVLVTAYDTRGIWRGGQRMRAHLQLRPGSTAQVQYEVMARLDLPPGRYQLRFAGESGMEAKSGSVFYDVDVPEFSKSAVSLSGVILETAPAVPSAGWDSLAGLLPVVPTARREFWISDRATAFVRVYQRGGGTRSSVAVRARVVDATDRAVLDRSDTLAPGAFATARSADYRVEIPAAGLPPGPYLLTIEATLAGKAPARREIRFVMR
jgi:VWFA-related protein